MSDNREQWGSKFGFIMAAAGCAVGLGNIWRFPYLTGQNGGAVFVYVVCVMLVGAPLLINEIALGRLTGKSPVAAFRATGANGFWTAIGTLNIGHSNFNNIKEQGYQKILRVPLYV